MAIMEVIVNKLNRRRNPVIDFNDKSNVVDVVVRGTTFESVDEIENALGKWYKDADGYYYWANGLKQNPEEAHVFNSYKDINQNLINWNDGVAQIPVEWRTTKGRGVKIAILDTGIFHTHEDFKNAISVYEDLTSVKDKIDYDGHGTHVAGIIGSRSQTINGLIGVAPDSDLFIYKVLFDEKDGTSENYQRFIQALEMAKQANVDIINMSFSLSLGDSPDETKKLLTEELRTKIKEITSENIAIVAAAGDKADLKNGNLFFPAVCDEVISVAAINQGYFDRNPIVHKNLNFVAPYLNYYSTFKEPQFYEFESGCSMSTAFISGILGLVIAANRKNKEKFSKSQLLSFMGQHSINLDQIDYNDNSKFSYNLKSIG
jgi:minor extracellular protease Epr